jgi:hypothetical protein
MRTRPEIAEDTMRECALMFGLTADLGHKFMRLVFAGHLPKQV